MLLKTQLFNIINDHTDRGYGGLYTTYLTSDVDNYYENNGTMLDMYTENPTGTECEYVYGGGLQDDGTLGNAECQRYNREHLIPQSVYSSATPMYSDAHCVVPSDKYVNAQRDNWPFSKVNTATNTYSNGSKKGQNLNSGYSSGYTGTVFEPIDEFKGDIARMIFYFVTRYESKLSGFSTGNMLGTSTYPGLQTWERDVLLAWHNLDPVSQAEINRNNASYTFQGNRNPFIDNPNYVCDIWITQCNTVDILSSESFSFENKISIYPNPAINNEVTISSETELKSIVLYNINGQIIQEIKNPTRVDNSYKVNNLSSGFYLVQLASENGVATKKVIVN